MNRFSSFLLGAVAVLAALTVCACAGQAPLQPKAVELNQAGVDALSRGELDVAEARFALALEFHPRFVDALVNLGLVEMQRGNLRLAQDKLERAVSINRHVAQPHHGLGVLAERQGRAAEAAEHYRDALEIDPAFVPARANLARLYFDAGRLDDAREQFLRLVEVAPDYPPGYVGLAETLLRLGREDQADQVIARGLHRAGEVPGLRLLAARALLRDGDIDGAERLLALLTDGAGPTVRAAWGWMGVARLLRNDLQGSIACAEHALELDRDDPLATFVLAMSLSARGDSTADQWLERAGVMSPGNSVITYERARQIVLHAGAAAR